MNPQLVEGFRLSPPQRHLWLRQGDDVGPYRVCAAVSLRGPIDRVRLEAAIDVVVFRHEALRTTYRRLSGMTLPMQIVEAEERGEREALTAFATLDLCGLDAATQQEAIEAVRRELAGMPVDLDRGPLWQARLLRRSAAEHTLLLMWPSVVADAASVAIVVRELARWSASSADGDGGEAASSADAAAAQDLPLQHVDVAEWQEKLVESDGTAAGREFWRQLDRSALMSSRLALRRRARETAPFAPRTLESTLPADLVARLVAWTTVYECSQDDVLLAAWQLLMSRLSERTDLALGLVSDGRAIDDLDAVVGPLSRTLPVRCQIDDAYSFAAWVEQSRAARVDHVRWQSLFTWQANGASESEPEPFCPLAFESQTPVRIAAGNGAVWSLDRIEACADRFELKTTVTSGAGRWDVRWTFDEQIHSIDQVTCIADQYVQTLRSAFDAAASLAAIDIRGEWERVHARSVPAAFNRPALGRAAFDRHVSNRDVLDQQVFSQRTDAAIGAAVDAPVDALVGAAECFQPIHRRFERIAARWPQREAIVGDDERLTYAALNARAEQVAGYLRAHGVGAETRVGLLLDRSCDLLVAILGVLKAGAAFVPLPPEQPIARLASLADRVGAAIVISQRRLSAAWPDASPIALLRLDDEREQIAAPLAASSGGSTSIHPANLAYVMFTSGSTGEPKGVMIPHGALAHYVEWSAAAYVSSPDVSVLLHSSIGFDATLTSLLVPLCTGARVIAVSAADNVEAVAAITELPSAGGVQAGQPESAFERRGFLKVTPAHLGLLADRVSPDQLSALGNPLVIGGDALTGEQLAAWRAHSPSTRIVNEYGPTEAAVGCIVHDTLVSNIEPGPVSIGHPVAGTTSHVLDREGRTAAVGVTGELFIGGAQLARGYLGRPDLTAERFLPDPLAATPGARCYRTGDLVRLAPDGALDYVGRRDQQVKIRGHRVELAEVETAIRQQPGVRETAVILREDVPGERRLVAYVTTVDADAADAKAVGTMASDRLQQALRAVLPEFMVPALIVPLDQLPMTANGKVDRKRLPLPDAARPRLAQAYVAPRTEAEAILARVWAEVLRLERIGIHDNFFALGGDSIVSLQIVARAARAGLRLAPRLVFEHQTVEALAAVSRLSTVAVVDQAPVTGLVPLTPVQQWFFSQPVEDRHHYNQALALDLLQPLPPAVLSDAWRRLQIHHDALRLRYRQTDAGWEQRYGDLEEISTSTLTVIDASAVAAADREAAWTHIAGACQKSLDLERGPIARAVLVDWGAGAPPRLFLVLHHVLADGVTWRVLLEDLQELSRREPASGAAIDLPPKTISLKAWSEKLLAFVRGGGFDDELPHWIGASQAGAAVRRDRETGANTIASQRTESIAFTVEQTQALVHRLPAALDTAVQDVLLTGLLLALVRTSGEHTWRIDLEGHGRETLGGDDDVSRTIGWFTSVYPIRLTAPAAADVDAVATLRAVRAAVRAVPRYGVGYGALRYLRDDVMVAPLREAATPDIIFNYWGQLDHVFAASPTIRPAAATVGPARSPRQLRSHLFEISASVVDGRLQVGWTYSAHVHEPQTIARLAALFVEAVGQLAALGDEVRAQLKTPADFPLADLTETELQQIVADAGPIADVYPLSPLQEGMLFHRLYERDEAIYTQQFAARLSGPLDAAAFERAWNAAVERHDTLRTGFAWERREQPLQVVRERVALPWTFEDWRGVDRAEQDARLVARLAADRRRGFDVGQPPLMRVDLIRLAEDRWHVLWTSHHIVLDGWSMPIVVRDVLMAYAAQQEGAGTPDAAAWSEPPAARYRDYIAWLRRQDHDRAEAFWRGALAGIKTPTLVAGAARAAEHDRTEWPRAESLQAESSRPESPRDMHRAELPAVLVDALQRLGASHGITMNSWFAGVWALLLSHCTRQDEVVFGAVVSGRPPDLPGIEGIAGLFINTLPFRLRIAPRASALAWFAECQRRQVEAREYEYTSLARIQSWSPMPKGTPLFDTIFVFENYPVEQVWRQQTTLRLDEANAVAPTSYPVEVEVAGMASGTVVSIAVDPDRVGVALARLLAAGFERTLSRLAANPEETIGALLDSLDELTLGADAARSGQRHSQRQASLRALKSAAAGAARPGLSS